MSINFMSIKMWVYLGACVIILTLVFWGVHHVKTPSKDVQGITPEEIEQYLLEE